MGVKEMYPLNQVIYEAFEKSDVLVVEINSLDHDFRQQMEIIIQELGRYPVGETLEQHLSQTSKDELARIGIDLGPLNQFRVWFAMLALKMQKMESLGFTNAFSVTNHFLHMAKSAKKPVIELEGSDDIRERIVLLINEDNDLLTLLALTHLRVQLSHFPEVFEAWARGHVREFERLWFYDSLSREEFKPLVDILIYERNRALTLSIEKLLTNTQKTYFIVAPADSLVGERCLISNLHNKGFKVGQVNVELFDNTRCKSAIAAFLSRRVYELIGQLKYPEAIQAAEEELVIWEKIRGPNDLYVAQKLNALAGFYENFADRTKAETLYKRALAIVENVSGPDHPNVAMSLDRLAYYYEKAAEYEQAENLYDRALEIREKAPGLHDRYVAGSITNLARLYQSLGDYKKAESYFKRSLTINQKAFGPDSLEAAMILDNLGSVYDKIGNYAKAEDLYMRALENREKLLGPDHPDLAKPITGGLTRLARFYSCQKDMAKAAALYKRALEINEKAFGLEHPNVVGSLRDWAFYYEVCGDYAKAEPLLKRSLMVNKKIFGLDSLQVVRSLDELAGLYSNLGNYTEAESLYRRSLEIKEKILRADHQEIAWSLFFLAILSQDLGDYPKAEAFYKQALEIQERSFGQNHEIIATTLEGLAQLYRSLSDYTKAEILYKRLVAIREKTSGAYSTFAAGYMTELAEFYAENGDFEKAHSMLTKVQLIDKKLIEQAMGFTSESQKIRFIGKKRKSLNAFLGLVAQHLIHDSHHKQTALDTWLIRKGIVLEAQKRYQEALVYSVDPQALKTFQDLSRARTQLSKLTFGGSGKGDLDAYKKRIADLEEKKDRLEAKLSQLSEAFALGQKIAEADCAKIARSLPAKTVLIEFARVEMFDFKAKEKGERWKPAHYLAFILHAGNGDKVGMIDLGNAEEIDKAVAQLKKEISVMDEKSMKSSRKIYDLVFEPIRKQIGDVKEIFISPDGNLNLIPFEVIMGPDHRYLIEDYTFNYLAAGRDVIGFGQIHGESGKALLMGDPDFDLGYMEKESMLRKGALVNGGRKLARRSVEMNELHFARLPGAREEVKAIQKILGGPKNSDIFLGSDALEEVLKQTSAPKWVHLATHGFFLKDQEVPDMPTDLTTMRAFSLMTPFKHKGIKVRIENSMLRSGFALAGANRAFQVADEQMEDGIVTSEEILGLKLRGTDMVVLSACNTGIGDVKAGEGVFGLRRAFAQAGAKSLVMSMWDVPDKETRELMVAFYRNIALGKMNRCQALRDAALKEMKIVKKRYGHTYPLCWGGFVLVGDPGEPSKNGHVK